MNLENMKLKSFFYKLFILLASVIMLITAFKITGIQESFHHFFSFPIWLTIAILVLFILNLLTVSLRLSIILSHFGIHLPKTIILKANISGYLSSLFFISLFGQVIGRNLILQQHGVSPVINANIIAYERLILLFVSGSLATFGIIYLFDHLTINSFLTNISLAEVIISVSIGVGLSLFLGKTKFEKEFLARLFTRNNILNIFKAAGATLLAQSFVLGSFIIAILAVKPETSFWALLAAAAITSFAASLPITINGWGIRELTAAYTFGQLGIDNATAVATSILIGLCSTAAILMASPALLKKHKESLASSLSMGTNKFNIIKSEKTAAYIITSAVAALILFQIHITILGQTINLNLADPFAILAIAIAAIHIINTRKFPRWSIPEFNKILAGITLLLIFAFINSIFNIGLTTWALNNRLIGWLILVGYISIGYLTIIYLGSQGRRRFFETLICTATAIIFMQIVLRLLHQYTLIDIKLPFNFEGYSANRNAFAFQMLVCLVLFIIYAPIYLDKVGGGKKEKNSKRHFLQYLFSLFFGIIMAGILFSSSRTALIILPVLVIATYLTRMVDRKIIICGVFFAILIWGLPWFIEQIYIICSHTLPSRSISYSNFSNPISNTERMETIKKGLELWRKHPFLGAGLGAFFQKSPAWFPYPIVIHSTPVWILVEFGLLGFVLAILAFARLLYSAIKNKLRRPYHRGVIILLLVFVAFSLPHEMFYQRIFWLVLGMLLASSQKIFPPKPFLGHYHTEDTP